MSCASRDLFLAYTDTRSGTSDVYGERYVPPIASFVAAPTIGVAPLTVVLTDTSTASNGITAWQWDFGDGVTSTLQNLTHTYSLFGSYSPRLTIQTEWEGGHSSSTPIVILNSPPPTTTITSYTYDGLYRLTRAAYSSGETFDYEYDAANRLTNVNSQAYTWDNNGNLTNDGSKVYTYTQANRLITVTASGLTWSAAYNGDGARLKQVANGTPTTYTQDLAAPLPVVLQAQTGTTATLYLFDMGTRPLAEYDSAWEYLLPDGLGSVRQLVDASGNVKLAEAYEPYGSVLSSRGSATSAFSFTGEQLDNYIGLVFLRARYMQPTVGVFLSRDPWSGDTLRPLTYNGWAYVEGNPVNRNDPSGYCGGGGPSGSKARVCGTASNNPPGLAFRSGAGIGFPTINPPDRLQDGTQVQLLSASTQPDVNGLRWRQVSIDGGAKGYVADVYLEPVSSGGGGTGERWWPFGKGVGYLKGKLYEGPSPLHNGIDLISANDPLARYARSVPGQGFTYNSICANTSPNVNNTSREVYAIADGKIESIAPAGSDVNSSLINQTWTANGNTYWVQYTHVKAEISEGQQVYKDAPTLIGRYGFYGNHGNIAHLHLTVKVNGQLANPGDYLPDASPVFPPGLFPIWGP